MRVVTGSRPGAFGCRTSPVNRRLWKTAPTGTLSPIFFSIARYPSGVVIRPQESPRPNMDVDTGYVATFPPFCTSISFWSRTLMISWLEVSSGMIAKAEAAEIRLKISATGRNMRTLLLDDFEFVTRELQRSRAKCQNYFSTRDCRMKKGKRKESRPETSAGTARKEAVRAQWRTPRNR